LENIAITLRNWSASDTHDLAIIANYEQVAALLRNNFPTPFSIAHATDFIDRNRKQSDGNIQKAIICNDKLVGAISVELKDDIFKYNAELGYWVTPDFWGKGIATKAIELMIELTFAQLKINRLYAEVFSNNAASIRILEKCNFVKEGILKNAIFKNGQFLDCYIFALYIEPKFLPINQ
jgi:ribosomal-protein-alanine N-acetyltransferase